MKRASFWRAGAVAPLLVVCACERFSGGEGGGSSTSSTSSSGAETTGAEASTSSRSSTSTEASVASTGTESASSTGGAGPTLETVTVVDAAGAAVASARIVVNDAAGDVVTEVATMADGTVMVDVPDGGSATYLPAADAEGDLWSYAYLDVPPGGAVKFVRQRTDDVPSNPHGPVTFSVAVMSPPANATFRLAASCALTSEPASNAMFSFPLAGAPPYEGCNGIDQTSLLLVAYGSNQRALSSGLKANQALPASSASHTFTLGDTLFERKDWDVLSAPASMPYALTLVGWDTDTPALAASPLLSLRTTYNTTSSFARYADIPTGIERAQIQEQIQLQPMPHLILRQRTTMLAAVTDPIGNWTPTSPSTPLTDDLLDFTDLAHVKLAVGLPAQPPPSDVLVIALEQDIGGGATRNTVIYAPAVSASRVIPALPADAAPGYPTFAQAYVTYVHGDFVAIDGYAATAAQGVIVDGSVDLASDFQFFRFQP